MKYVMKYLGTLKREIRDFLSRNILYFKKNETGDRNISEMCSSIKKSINFSLNSSTTFELFIRVRANRLEKSDYGISLNLIATNYKINVLGKSDFSKLFESYFENYKKFQELSMNEFADDMNLSIYKIINKVKKLKEAMKSKVEEKIEGSENMIDYINLVLSLLTQEYAQTSEPQMIDDAYVYYQNSQFNTRDDYFPNIGDYKGNTLVNAYLDPELTYLVKKIFRKEWMPNAKEIKQGVTGDCYLIAALNNLVIEDPKSIKKCFVKFDARRNLVTMVFHKVKVIYEGNEGDLIKFKSKKAGTIEIVISTNTVTALIDAAMGGDPFASRDVGGIWVRLLEKGYSLYCAMGNNIIDVDGNFKKILGKDLNDMLGRRKYQLQGNLNLALVESGMPFIPQTAICGKSGTYLANRLRITDSSHPKVPTIDDLKKILDEKKTITIGTCGPRSEICKKKFEVSLPLSRIIEGTSLSYSHAYSVKEIRTEDGKQCVVLSDPRVTTRSCSIIGNKFTISDTKTGEVIIDEFNFQRIVNHYNINKVKKRGKDKRTIE